MPESLEDAAPDVELADAQVALGAAGFARERDEGDERYDGSTRTRFPRAAASTGDLRRGGGVGLPAVAGAQAGRPRPAGRTSSREAGESSSGYSGLTAGR